ncbi:MAG TPA: FAD-dependent oxidoreductase [Syntrophales bacterium]|nr:FAD-dependent oxidoreductase [Syntrophales bacterium]
MKRQNAQVLIVGGGPGGRVSYMVLKNLGVENVRIVANEEPTVICSLPYGVGCRLIPEGPEAVVVNLAQSDRLPKSIVEDLIPGNVISLDPAKHEAVIRGRDGEIVMTFDNAILAPGAAPWLPPADGLLKDSGPDTGTGVFYGNDWLDKGRLAGHVHVLRGAPDARRLDELAAKGKNAVVVGSGAIGLEMAEALHDRGMKPTVLEVLEHLVSALDADMAAKIEDRLRQRSVSVFKGREAAVKKVLPGKVELQNGRVIPCDGVIFATGVRPDLRLARGAGLTVEKGIVVDSSMRTSAEGIYAVGDAAQIADGATGLPILPFVGTLAMREAVVAASAIAGRPMPLPPVAAWGVSAVFGLNWGSVGWTAEAAKRAGIATATLIQPIRTRDHFMPEGQDGVWKLVVASAPHGEVKSGQILGFQVVQEGESPLTLAERFIDIVARKETVVDLFGHYFIHSPVHNAVNDPYLGLLFQAQRLFRKAG